MTRETSSNQTWRYFRIQQETVLSPLPGEKLPRNKIWKLSLITCILALEDCKPSCLWTLSGSLFVHRHKTAAGIAFANPCYACQRHPHSSTTIPWKDLRVIAPGDFSTNTLRPLSFTGTQHGSPAPWSSPDECSIVLITACPVGWTWAEKISGSHFKLIR